MALLEILNLSVSFGEKEILHDVSLQLQPGKVSFLLGRNGAGKTTLAQTLIGDTTYKINSGKVTLNEENNALSLLELKPEERSKRGLFVSFQNPPEIEGVSLMNFLHTIYVEKFGNEDPLSRSTFKFRKYILSLLERLNLNSEFIERSLNVGFSGGEKKRVEILQMLLLKPTVVILDEIDSGLDIHALSILQDAVKEIIENQSTVLFITHNVDFVRRYKDSNVYILENGKITSSENEDVLSKFIAD